MRFLKEKKYGNLGIIMRVDREPRKIQAKESKTPAESGIEL